MTAIPPVPDIFGDLRPSEDQPIGAAMGSSARSIVTLVLDSSGSMGEAGKADQLVRAVNGWIAEGRADAMLADTVDLGAVAFGGDGVRQLELGPPAPTPAGAPGRPFTVLGQATLAPIRPAGPTPLGAALDVAVQVARTRRVQLVEACMETYRPVLVVVSDGLPTDDWTHALPQLRELEQAKRLLVFCVGVDGMNREVLEQVSPSGTYGCDVTFRSLVQLLSASTRPAPASGGQATADDLYASVRRDLAALVGDEP